MFNAFCYNKMWYCSKGCWYSIIHECVISQFCPVKPRHLRYVHYCKMLNWHEDLAPYQIMVGLHPLSDLGCIIQNRYELQSQRILGVDRKGWVPVPHPGYHYILKNIYGKCPFHQFRFKDFEHLLLGSGGTTI